MTKNIVTLAAFFGLISIILGAFGAHAFKDILTTEQLISFETGVRYQMYHALFLLLISQISILSEKNKRTIGILTTIGIFMFSGSIYLLATQELSGINFKFLGPITPIGGVFLIVSWFLTAFYSIKQKSNK